MRLRGGRTRDERGAAAVFTAACVALLVAMAAFAVDLGMQRVLRRDMQALADVVALDMARHVDGRKEAVIKDAVDKFLADSVARNTDLTAQNFTLEHKSDDSLARSEVSDLVVWARLGTMDPATGEFTETGKQEAPDAVRVSASSTVDFAFATGSGAAGRSAVAQAEGGACFAIGSYAARVKTASSPLLGPILGAINSNLAAGVLDYDALAAADVELVDLLGVNTDVGTIEQVLEGDKLLTVGQFALAMAEVLKKDSGNTATVTALETLVPTLPGMQFDLGEILDVDTGSAAGLSGALNAFDLLTGAVFASDGNHAVSIPGLNVDLGELLDVQADAHITEPPQQGCGRKGEAAASNSQVQVDLDSTMQGVDVPGLLSVEARVYGSGTDADGDSYAVQVAPAAGTLTDIRCEPPGITANVTGGLIDVDVTVEVDLEISVLGLVEVPVSGTIRVQGESPSLGEDAVVNVQNGDYSQPVHVGSDSGLPALTTTSSFTLGDSEVPVGDVLTPLTNNLVNPLVSALDDVVVTPLLHSLGMEVAGADVYAKPEPRCNEPVLRR